MIPCFGHTPLPFLSEIPRNSIRTFYFNHACCQFKFFCATVSSRQVTPYFKFIIGWEIIAH